MRVGVFVGSFDPVHTGHTAIMNYLVSEKIVDKVLVIPTGNYWDKQNITELNKRIEMLELISSDEIIIDKVRNNYEYTYQILDSLNCENSENKYYLVMGMDNFEKIHLWKEYERILKHGVIVIKRDGYRVECKKDGIIFIDKSFGEVSSTMIRKKIKDGKYQDISSFLDRNVLEYIMKKKLYR